MSRSAVLVTMKSGEKHHLAGYQASVSQQINDARGKGKLVEVEKDSIPTGQMMHIDPDQVESVKDDRW